MLRSFVTVADELHFGRAAERLHLAGPAISQQIKALERELGVRLLDRDNRRVTLTDAGATLLPHAREIVARLDATRELMARVATGTVGTVRLGVPAGLPAALVPELLAALAQRAPQVEVRLRPASTNEQLDLLERGDLDAGLVRHAGGDLLERRAVHEAPVGIAVPAGHPLAAMDVVPASALSGETLIGPEPSMLPPFAAELTAALEAAGARPAASRESPDPAASLALVGAGLGVSVKTEEQMHQYGAATVGAVWRPFADVDVRTTVWMTWRTDRVSPALSTLLEVLAVGLPWGQSAAA